MSSLSVYLKTAVALVFFVSLCLTLNTYYLIPEARADEVEDLQAQIDELNKARLQSVAATKPLEGQLVYLKKQLSYIQSSLQTLSDKIVKREKDLNARTEKIAVQQSLLETRVRSYYIRSYLASPLFVIFSSESSANLFRELSYRQAATREDQKIIASITGEIVSLLTQKEKLEKDKSDLANLRIQVDKNAAFLGGEIKKAEAYQSDLSSKIASLTLKQQQIIAAKQSSLNLPTSLGAGPLYCTDDRKLNPGFSPAFAFFTYGIPHRVGMNQYGALGRARAGQNHEDILRAYFNNVNFETRGNNNIKVQGHGEMPLETYLLGIYEMPEDWPLEALKAQAVSARSYALAYTDNGAKEICTTQACQVYKSQPKSGAWKTAVEQTAGKVLVSGGQVISAWYASTSGGYTFTSQDIGWGDRPWTKRLRDTVSDITSLADLSSKAYDKDSPCFYAAQGFRKEYDKSAWLKSEEVADIVNVILLTQKDKSVATHLYQTDKPNPEGQENWDRERVKQELRQRGGSPLNSVSSISMTPDLGTGQTTSVNVSGDGGAYTLNGAEFRNFFNLRAPANIQVVGPLFDIERK